MGDGIGLGGVALLIGIFFAVTFYPNELVRWIGLFITGAGIVAVGLKVLIFA